MVAATGTLDLCLPQALLRDADPASVRKAFRVIRCDAESCAPGPRSHVIHARHVTTRTSEIVFDHAPSNVLLTKKWHDKDITKAALKFGSAFLQKVKVRATRYALFTSHRPSHRGWAR